MDNKEYLNEEGYQKNKKKINKVGTVLLIIGCMIVILSIAWMIVGLNILHTEYAAIGGPFLILGFAFLAFGGQLKFISHGREISSYMAQQQMPVAKEGIEKMSPSAGVAAKEIAKGIKEGLKEEDK